ncbi:FAD-dependent oxidoreductase [Streptomyces sp. CA-210063]|uniref:FAD-dependent oxidoreductase n=1 Tax=Streptomyces sp. CA-210063 TaxID=2801029 RepID=UPI00214CE43C|nr:FAD-dependent oxidoreductase [Streptomyces sp. CA-210063]UUU28585.1 FAD-dependent oxidoreductase [Streptomyces sp. CA-210063]
MAANTGPVIVGAGLAGAKTARTLREESFDGPIALLGQESERPHERRPLFKGYLLGKDERETVHVHPPQWFSEHDSDLRLGTTVTAIDPAGHDVTLADGSRIGYAKLLLTTGSSPRRPPVPGADLERVHHPRRLSHSGRIKEAFTPASRIPVIGAGRLQDGDLHAARAAGVNVDVRDVTDPFRALGTSERPVDPTRLADPDVPLSGLLGRPDSPDDSPEEVVSR